MVINFTSPFTKAERDKYFCYDFELKELMVALEDSSLITAFDISSDSKTLLISSTSDNSKGELYLYYFDSNNKVKITDNEFVESGAKFGPNDAFVITAIQTTIPDTVNHGGNSEIFEINLQNNELRQITKLGGFSALPDYSPNFKHIAFHNCNAGICDIYVIGIDGSNLTNLTRGFADNRWPRWSYDGKWIAFTRSELDNSDIYLISPQGRELTPIIKTKFRDEIAEFRPLR